MDENQKKLEEHALDGFESGDEVKPRLLEISEEELKQILKDHQKWLESDGKEGKKAELKETNLKKANLKDASLQKASLRRADLRDSDLGEADLREANLSKANLQGSIMGFANLRAAILEEANLRGAYLVGADLQGAYLGRANFREANLMEANLCEADLSEAILEKANLFDTELNDATLFDTNFNYVNLTNAKGLKESKLQYANLEKTTGLIGTELMQTNITGTKLPENYNAFNTLQVVEESSKNARKIFFAMLLGCIYSWLTIATTTDVRLLTNSASSPLPIIGTEISIAWFYWVAPFVILCLYLYFHYYLNGLWEALSGLPAIFPDGKRLDERAYPWLLNKLVRRHFILLKENRPLIAHQQEWIIIFLTWWAVPLTFFGFWLRYLPCHDWFGTWIHMVFLVISVAAAIWFYRLAAIVLKAGEKRPFSWMNFWRERNFLRVLYILLIAILTLVISDGSINGIRWNEKGEDLMLRGITLTNYKEIIPCILKKLGYEPFADFREKVVSEKPANYLLINAEERIDSIKGANLRGRNLKYADMNFSFLIKAELQGAKLQYAKLAEANLNSAKLMNANLNHADLVSANLERANLSEASIKGADLSKAVLRQADLYRVNLQDANLYSATLEDSHLVSSDLKNANLKYAISQKANLTGANLSGADLSYASFANAIFREAHLNNANLIETNLSEADLNYAKLANANLTNAYLHSANLCGANLQGANFQGTNLHGANLCESNLEGAKNLYIEQLSRVATLYNAKLNPKIMSKVKLSYPNLLEKP